MSANEIVGSVVALRRYPVKSMQGEELNASPVSARGLLGDRSFALVDAETGKVISAKNPKRWPQLFAFRAAFVQSPQDVGPLPALHITLPDGRSLVSDNKDVDQALSAALGRPVTLRGAAPESPVLEEYWPDMPELPHQDKVTDEKLPPGTFFDLAAVHILTTATLARLRAFYPEGQFEARRFRPNIMLATEAAGFTEDDWTGRTLAIGTSLRLQITGPCPRYVMTTLAQAELPYDPGILRTAARQHGGNVGAYATVVQSGVVRCGDPVRLAS